jgi:hypothetical protein
LDVNVCAQPGVIGQIPAIVVRVCVDHDVVTVPIPVVAVGEVEIGNAEGETAKPETAGFASFNPPPVATAEAAVEVAILPRVLDAKAIIVSPAVVSHPFAVAVDVRCLRVTLAVVEMSVPALVTVALVRVAMMTLRPVAGNVSAAHIVVAVVVSMVIMVAMLRQRRQREDQERGNNCGDQLHEVRTLRCLKYHQDSGGKIVSSRALPTVTRR